MTRRTRTPPPSAFVPLPPMTPEEEAAYEAAKARAAALDPEDARLILEGLALRLRDRRVAHERQQAASA